MDGHCYRGDKRENGFALHGIILSQQLMEVDTYGSNKGNVDDHLEQFFLLKHAILPEVLGNLI